MRAAVNGYDLCFAQYATLSIAREKGHTQIIELLEKAGAKE
jgi:hypothetical protein